MGGKSRTAQRVIYPLVFGAVLTRKHRVIMTCGDRLCCNPSHMEVYGNDWVTTGHKKVLSQEEVAQIVEMRREGVPIAFIGARFGIDQSYVTHIVKGRRRNLVKPILVKLA